MNVGRFFGSKEDMLAPRAAPICDTTAVIRNTVCSPWRQTDWTSLSIMFFLKTHSWFNDFFISSHMLREVFSFGTPVTKAHFWGYDFYPLLVPLTIAPWYKWSQLA